MADKIVADSSNEVKAGKSRKKPIGFLTRVRRYFINLAIVCVIFLFALPWLTSFFLHENFAEEWISEQIPGNIEIGDASLGWQSPILLNDVTYASDAGNQIVHVKAVTSNQSLWDFVRRPQTPIELEFEGMNAALVVPQLEPHESQATSVDIHSVMEKILNYTLPQMEREMTIQLIESQLELTDSSGKVLTRWKPVTGTYHSIPGTNPQQSLILAAPVVPQGVEGESTGRFQVNANWIGASPAAIAEVLTLDVDCVQQPLAALEPLLDTYFPTLFPLEPVTGKLIGSVERVGQEELMLKLATQFVDHRAGVTSQPPIAVDIDAAYSQANDRIDVRRLYSQLDETTLDVQGDVTDVSGKQNVDARGQFQSPAEGLTNLLPEELRKNIKFKDVEISDLSMKGPLRPDPSKPFDFVFEISSNVSWKEATAYGLKSNDGKVKLSMLGQRLEMTPISIPVSGGHIRQLPSFDFQSEPMTISVKKGLLLERVALTDEICRDWLRYVSPVLSNATSPSGTFSLTTEAGAFQLDNMSQAKLAGTLQIHKAQVKPGPMAKQIVDAVSAVRVLNGKAGGQRELLLMTLRDQSVEYQVVDGRVYHSGFQFEIGNFAFASNGSVGFDDTLDIVVSMAFPDELVNRGPILSVLKDETLDFRITGTINKPVVDGRVLKDFGKRIGINAAGGLLERILERRQEKGKRKRDR